MLSLFISLRTIPIISVHGRKSYSTNVNCWQHPLPSERLAALIPRMGIVPFLAAWYNERKTLDFGLEGGTFHGRGDQRKFSFRYRTGAGKAACVWRKKDPGKVLKIFCVSGFRKNLELNGQTMLAFSPGLW